MRHSLRVAVLLAALGAASAFAQTSTRTFPGLTWDFSSGAPGFGGCTLMALDATGGSTSVHYTVYGYVSCPSLGGSYLADGNAYFDASGSFNMQLDVGVASKLLCTSLNGFSGSCGLYTNGSNVGSAFISLR